MIFQKLYYLKNYRKFLPETPIPAFHYGLKPTILAAAILSKLSTHSYFSQLNLQLDCNLLAADLIFSIFNLSLPHPQVLTGFSNYRLKEILKETDLFANREELVASELLLSLENSAWLLIDYNYHVKTLPMLTFMDYIASEVLFSSVYIVRSKLLKSIALSNLSLCNDSLQLLINCCQEKGIGGKEGGGGIWGRESEFWKKEKGSLWFNNGGITYFDDLPFYDDKNKETIEAILAMELPKNYGYKYGLLNVSLFKYAKCMLLLAIHHSEVFEKQENNDYRVQNLKKIELSIRSLLKNLSSEEEVLFHLNEYYKLEARAKSDMSPELTQKLKEKKIEISQLISSLLNINDSSEQELFFKESMDEKSYPGTFNNHVSGIKEEGLNYYEGRLLRVCIMVRSRSAIASINCIMGLWTRANFVIRKGISNLASYCYEMRMVETGEEPENQINETKVDEKKKGGPPAGKIDPKKGALPQDGKDNKSIDEVIYPYKN
jgi:hypothetical protein